MRHTPHVVSALANVRITLIDKRNCNLLQPVLYQMATGLVSKSDVTTPLRELVSKQDNVQVLLGEVTTENPEGKQIVFNSKDIAAIVTGGSRPTFRYVDFGNMALVHASASPTCMASNFPDAWACCCGPSFTWP